MNILHINTHDTGGAAIAAIRLHEALLSEGIQSQMLFLNQTSYFTDRSHAFVHPNKNLVQKATYLLGYKLGLNHSKEAQLYTKIKGKPDGYELFSFPYSKQPLEKNRYIEEADILHLHWVAGFVDIRKLKAIGKPIVWSMHDMVAFTGGCHYALECKGFTQGCYWCPQLRGTGHETLAGKLFQEKKEIYQSLNLYPVALSEWMKAQSEKSNLFSNIPIEKIYNPINFNSFRIIQKSTAQEIFQFDSNKTHFLFVSAFIDNKRKGIHFIKDIANYFSNSDVIFHALGYERNIKAANQIHFIKKIEDPRLLSILYNAADALIVPSIQDNLPNTMLEAMACGTPVIGFPVGGLQEVIQRGYNGLLAKEVSAKALQEAIEEFIAKKNDFDSTAIRNFAYQHFAPQKVARQYIQLYQKALHPHDDE